MFTFDNYNNLDGLVQTRNFSTKENVKFKS